MKKRHAYYLELISFPTTARRDAPSVNALRRPSERDIDALAELMMDAYRDTIDYDGETIEDAVTEVKSYFSHRDGRALLACSNLALGSDSIVSACLVGWWRERRLPMIAYLMTGSSWKSQGLGAAVLTASLRDLSDRGHERVAAVITEGNIPSEIVHERAGFIRWHD